MRIILLSVLKTLIFALLLINIATASRIPSTNLAIMIKTEKAAFPEQNILIISALEKEMKLKGFMGRIRILDQEKPLPVSGETVIKITITENYWKTKKLLSIPYFLNRYTREFILESFVEIPEGRKGMSIKRMKAKSSTPARTQYNYNDKFDPGLFPIQAERLELEEKARRLLAKKLAGHLFNQLR